MLDKVSCSHGVMEGSGTYNRHAKIPAGGAALAAPLLRKAVPNVGLKRCLVSHPAPTDSLVQTVILAKRG